MPSRVVSSHFCRILALLVLAIFAPSCTDVAAEGVRGDWTAEREEHGDTTILRTLHGSVWGDTMVMIPELSIGTMEGEPPYVLGAIRSIEVDSEGRILLVDRQAREVRIYSPAGTHLQSIGRPGDGPGEFRNPDYVRIASDGRIVVRDQPGRFSVFSSDGTYVGDWPPRSGFSSGTPFSIDPLDRVLNPTTQDRLVRYDLDGSSLDTVAVPSRGYGAPQLLVTMENGGRASYSLPFMPAELWTYSNDGGFFFGMSDDYAIERWNPDGRVLRIERFVDVVPVSSAEAEQHREGITRLIRSLNAANWRWDGAEIPSVKPAYRRLASGKDGTLWVFRSTRGVEEPNPGYDPLEPENGFPTRWIEPVVADVFDAEGRYLGPVRFPDRVALYPMPVVTADAIWAATLHEDGYPQLVRFRLERIGGGD